jgi:tripartite-type tricarboxylate transporter receptor subunit TctC
LAAAPPAQAQQAVEDFYKGKSIDLYIGFTVGGGYDLYARLVARFLGDFIPGKPKIVPRNMPGAGSRLAANWVYNLGAKDGTIIATADQSLAVEQAMGDKAISIDVSKFNYIGNPLADNNTTVTWFTSGVATIEDAKKKDVILGATSPGATSVMIPAALNRLADTRFKIVQGYTGSGEMYLAMERGEVQGIGYYSSSNIFERNRSWLTEGKVRVLLQTGSKRHPELPDVPLVSDMALNETKRKVQDLWLAPLETARPFAMPQDVPKDRVAAIQAGFAAMLKDPDFQTDAKNSGMVVDPRSADEIRSVISMIAMSPQSVIDEARKAVQEE